MTGSLFSRGAEEKRPVSYIDGPVVCGVAEASLLLLATSLPRHCLGEWQHVSFPLSREKYVRRYIQLSPHAHPQTL